MKTAKGKGPGRWAVRLAVTALAMALLATVAGCAATGARLDRSQEVWRGFMDGQVTPGYRYYTTEVMNNPDAILGIDSKYTLVTERWAERDMTPELLRRLVGRMNNEYAAVNGLLGASVLNDKHEGIGSWYSPIGMTTVVMISDTEVRVDPPNPVALNEIRSRSSGR
jgi:hypothetical protein